ncbi:peptidase domain-containing ABC transporter [Abyssalbus ytuae]|uniref:ATP-binding cassette domain-containing protein n=1 Tax=Abyssalbus ytuae TaxID=2926907 RepID=A0A9E7CZF7_9FLAO|nr:ATP-binding cassette domain-containing protein [Abyssalbus ytuae]UOB17500.1 ATP-binding cassette domain-containing protein [Abyssalbus ytuae]
MAKEKYTPLKRFWGLLKLDRRDIYQILSYAIFAGLVNLSLPLGIQAIINLIQMGQVSTSWIVLVILVVLGVAFAGTLQLMQFRITENLQQKIFAKSSFEFAYRFPKIKFNEFYNTYPPELANRFFDTIIIQKGISKILIDFSAAILQVFFGILLLSFYHPFFILYGLALVGLIYIIFKFTAPKGLATSLDESKYKYKVAHWLQEIARSVNSFKLSGNTSHAMEKNDSLVMSYLHARESHFKVLVSQFIQLIGFKVLVTAGLLIIGGLLVLNQQMNIGQFVAAEIIILLIVASVEKLILGLETVYDVLTSLEKIGQVVDMDLENVEGERPFSNESDYSIKLENVNYRYPGSEEDVLHNINLEIKQGDKICIQGPNGSGKSTLVRILSGLLTPTKGNFYVGDRNMAPINLNNYRSYLGQVLTDETPFEGSIYSNITFGSKELTLKDVQWAVEKSGLSDYIRSLPEGLHSQVYPEGKQLSSAITRKILLARSIVKKPKILLYKDPLDPIDQEETERLMDFLTEKSNPWTLIVVSRNEKWTGKCSKIIHLDKGSVISVTKRK